jgi:hypothetical protein
LNNPAGINTYSCAGKPEYAQSILNSRFPIPKSEIENMESKIFLFQDYHCDSPLVGVRQAHVHSVDTHGIAESLRFPVQDKDRGLLPYSQYFRIQPGDSLRPTRPYRLEQRFFCRKTHGVMGDRVAMPVAKLLFRGSKHSKDKTVL